MKNVNFKFNPMLLFVFDTGMADNPNTNTTTDSGMSAAMIKYYDKRLIKMAGPKLVYHEFALKRPLPAHNGKQIVFHGWEDLDTTPGNYQLTEGKTPDGQKLSAYDIVATVREYGGFVGLTNLVQTTAIDDTVVVAVDKLSAQASVVLDKLHRNELIADEEVDISYAGGVENADALTTEKLLTVKGLKKLVAQLRRLNAPTIDGKYPFILHPDVAFDLSEDPDYKDQIRYADPKRFIDGYVGDLAGARLYESTNVKITKNVSGAPVYWNHLIGQDSYATVDLAGGGLKTIIKQLGSSGSEDPFNQRGTAAWYANTVTKVLIPKYIITFACSSTITPNEEDYET